MKAGDFVFSVRKDSRGRPRFRWVAYEVIGVFGSKMTLGDGISGPVTGYATFDMAYNAAMKWGGKNHWEYVPDLWKPRKSREERS